jgi:tRNA-splicing ligase RtcB
VSDYEFFEPEGSKVPIKAWVRGVPIEASARIQLDRLAKLPFIFRHVAVMPDVHTGIGSTVGTVFASTGPVIPAAVGVDLSCGMLAAPTSLHLGDVPEGIRPALRAALERAVPNGRTDNGGEHDRGAWHDVPERVAREWAVNLAPGYEALCQLHPKLRHRRPEHQLGTLGTGNHFLELSLDEEERLWIVLHSGSRGAGAAIGSYFTKLAGVEAERWYIALPDPALAYLAEGTDACNGYLKAVAWASRYAAANRELMLQQAVRAMEDSGLVPAFELHEDGVVRCAHNYLAKEHHFGRDVLVTRKGAIRARPGDEGIIPGSMGAATFIVRGRGNPESFTSASHGAGRVMSRGEAKRTFTLADHARDTDGIECDKSREVIDETPKAYKPIDAVMAAQESLVEKLHVLRQILCVKGLGGDDRRGRKGRGKGERPRQTDRQDEPDAGPPDTDDLEDSTGPG